MSKVDDALERLKAAALALGGDAGPDEEDELIDAAFSYADAVKEAKVLAP